MGDIHDLYQQAVLEHSRHPRYRQDVVPVEAEGRGDNPMCGDHVVVQLNFAPDGCIAQAGFQGKGCAISMASADLMAQTIHNMTPEQVRGLEQRFAHMVCTGHSAPDDASLHPLRVLSGVHEYKSRVKCATLPWRALMAALSGVKEVSK